MTLPWHFHDTSMTHPRHFQVGAYCVGKNIAHLPLTALYPYVFLLCFYPLFRPFAPFQAFYVVVLLAQWCGEGVGQLVSLQLTSSRQLAGGVAALLATVLTGSFPLLTDLPVFFHVLSFASPSRWAMESLVALEYFPWFHGDPYAPPSASGRCCTTLSPPMRRPPWENDGHSHCDWAAAPGSRARVVELVGSQYGYTLLAPWDKWFAPQSARDRGNDHGGVLIDVPTLEQFSFGSPQATIALVLIGVLLRVLVYASLLFKDARLRR